MSSVDITALKIKVESIGIREASAALGGLSTSAANTTRRITALAASLQRLQAINMASTTAMNAYMQKLQQQAALMQSLNTNSAGAAVSTAALAAAMALLAASLNALNQRTSDADRRQRRHNESMREANALARGLAGSLGALWMTYGNFAGMAVGLAIGASLKGIITVGKDVEHILEGIRVKGGETLESIDKIRESVFNLGRGMYGPQQVATAFETLILAGLKAEQALVSVNAALNLATVGGTTIEKAAMTLVSVGTAVGYSAEGFDRVGDVIAKTAALSMSSVASLSEAFKSGSSVNRLYGVSLEDIGTNLGVLSNLGIQGSAAGTAMKNFYKELAAGSSKVVDTLKSMGMSASDLKDTKGKFLPMLEVVEKLAIGTSKLKIEQRDLAAANLTNERGLRLYTQLLGEWNTETAKGSNALKDFRENVEKSHGFAAIGAVAMALTAKSQIDSMLNSLKTSFAETFTEMQPEIIAFTGRMKDVFASAEFKGGLKLLAQGFANFAIVIAENIDLIAKAIIVFTTFKVVLAGVAIVQSLIAGWVAMSAAITAATTAGTLFMAALGPIGIALAAVTALVVLYKLAQEDANKHTDMATNYSAGYISGLTEEANRLEKVNKQLDKKISLSEANAAITRGEARDKMVQLDKLAVAEAEYNIKNRAAWTQAGRESQALQLEATKLRAANNIKYAEAEEKRVRDNSRSIDAKVKANATNNRGEDDGEGTGTLDKGPAKSEINDKYLAAMLRQDGEIKAAKKSLRAEEEKQLLDFKAGNIGKLQFIEEMSKKEIEVYQRTTNALNAKLAAAKGSADKERFGNEIEQAEEDFGASKVKRAKEVEVEIAKATEEYTRFRIQQLELEGKFGEAATEKFRLENSVAFKQAAANALAYGDTYSILKDRTKAFESAQAAAIKEGFNKQHVAEFNVLAEATRNALRGVQTATEGQGLAAMFMAASNASDKLAANIRELREKMSLITDPKALNEAQAQLTNLAETQRKLWVGVGDSIGKSLSNAFGSAGKAVSDLIKVGVNYNNLENKSGQARVKSFGDAASAAKGFFKEGTSGYKVMAAAEKAFTLFQVAEALSVFAIKSGLLVSLVGVKLAADATAKASEGSFTVFSVAQSMIRAAWAGIEAVLNQGKGDPYTAFGRMAAMAAVVAGLGIAIGSVGGSDAPESSESRQKKTGAGSVFGDSEAKSMSIVNSLEIMEKNSGLGLAHSNGMLKALKNIEMSLGGFTNLVIRSGIDGKFVQAEVGGFFSKLGNSIFGGKVSVLDTGITAAKASLAQVNQSGLQAQQYTETKKDGGWFSSDKYSDQRTNLSSELNSQFSLIVNDMGKGITIAAEALGMGGSAFNDKLKTFIVDFGKVSLKGLTGEQIQEQFAAMFSKLGDDMAQFAIGGLDKFQTIGEGYMETLARVANNLMQVKDVFEVLGKSFMITGMAAVEVSENLIKAAGSIEALTEGTKFFVDNFLTEAERMAPITNSVTKRLAELGVSELTSIELYKKKVRQLDLTNAADQAMYVALLELAPAFKEAADYAQDLIDGTVSLTRAQQKALDNIDKARDNLQKAYDKESDALQNTIDKTKAYVETLKSFQDSLKLGANSPLTNMEKYAEARRQFDATALAAKNGDSIAQSKIVNIATEFLNASKVINASGSGYTADYNTVLAMTTDLAGAAVAQIDTATASLEALNKQVEGLLAIDKSVMSVTQAIVELKLAILAGREAGLSNTAMGVPEVPVVTAIVAATNNAVTDKLVATVAELNTQIAALRDEQKAQTGGIIGATLAAADANAATTVAGVDESLKSYSQQTKVLELV